MYRAWEEQNIRSDTHTEYKTLACFPLNKEFLLTMRRRLPTSGRIDDFNQEITFFASFEQAEDFANTILEHIKKMRNANTSGTDNSLP